MSTDRPEPTINNPDEPTGLVEELTLGSGYEINSEVSNVVLRFFLTCKAVGLTSGRPSLGDLRTTRSKLADIFEVGSASPKASEVNPILLSKLITAKSEQDLIDWVDKVGIKDLAQYVQAAILSPIAAGVESQNLGIGKEMYEAIQSLSRVVSEVSGSPAFMRNSVDKLSGGTTSYSDLIRMEIDPEQIDQIEEAEQKLESNFNFHETEYLQNDEDLFIGLNFWNKYITYDEAEATDEDVNLLRKSVKKYFSLDSDPSNSEIVELLVSKAATFRKPEEVEEFVGSLANKKENVLKAIKKVLAEFIYSAEREAAKSPAVDDAEADSYREQIMSHLKSKLVIDSADDSNLSALVLRYIESIGGLEELSNQLGIPPAERDKFNYVLLNQVLKVDKKIYVADSPITFQDYSIQGHPLPDSEAGELRENAVLFLKQFFELLEKETPAVGNELAWIYGADVVPGFDIANLSEEQMQQVTNQFTAVRAKMDFLADNLTSEQWEEHGHYINQVSRNQSQAFYEICRQYLVKEGGLFYDTLGSDRPQLVAAPEDDTNAKNISSLLRKLPDDTAVAFISICPNLRRYWDEVVNEAEKVDNELLSEIVKLEYDPDKAVEAGEKLEQELEEEFVDIDRCTALLSEIDKQLVQLKNINDPDFEANQKDRLKKIIRAMAALNKNLGVRGYYSDLYERLGFKALEIIKVSGTRVTEGLDFSDTEIEVGSVRGSIHKLMDLKNEKETGRTRLGGGYRERLNYERETQIGGVKKVVAHLFSTRSDLQRKIAGGNIDPKVVEDIDEITSKITANKDEFFSKAYDRFAKLDDGKMTTLSPLSKVTNYFQLLGRWAGGDARNIDKILDEHFEIDVSKANSFESLKGIKDKNEKMNTLRQYIIQAMFNVVIQGVREDPTPDEGEASATAKEQGKISRFQAELLRSIGLKVDSAVINPQMSGALSFKEALIPKSIQGNWRGKLFTRFRSSEVPGLSDEYVDTLDNVSKYRELMEGIRPNQIPGALQWLEVEIAEAELEQKLDFTADDNKIFSLFDKYRDVKELLKQARSDEKYLALPGAVEEIDGWEASINTALSTLFTASLSKHLKPGVVKRLVELIPVLLTKSWSELEESVKQQVRNFVFEIDSPDIVQSGDADLVRKKLKEMFGGIEMVSDLVKRRFEGLEQRDSLKDKLDIVQLTVNYLEEELGDLDSPRPKLADLLDQLEVAVGSTLDLEALEDIYSQIGISEDDYELEITLPELIDEIGGADGLDVVLAEIRNAVPSDLMEWARVIPSDLNFDNLIPHRILGYESKTEKLRGALEKVRDQAQKRTDLSQNLRLKLSSELSKVGKGNVRAIIQNALLTVYPTAMRAGGLTEINVSEKFDIKAKGANDVLTMIHLERVLESAVGFLRDSSELMFEDIPTKEQLGRLVKSTLNKLVGLGPEEDMDRGKLVQLKALFDGDVLFSGLGASQRLDIKLFLANHYPALHMLAVQDVLDMKREITDLEGEYVLLESLKGQLGAGQLENLSDEVESVRNQKSGIKSLGAISSIKAKLVAKILEVGQIIGSEEDDLRDDLSEKLKEVENKLNIEIIPRRAKWRTAYEYIGRNTDLPIDLDLTTEIPHIKQGFEQINQLNIDTQEIEQNILAKLTPTERVQFNYDKIVVEMDDTLVGKQFDKNIGDKNKQGLIEFLNGYKGEDENIKQALIRYLSSLAVVSKSGEEMLGELFARDRVIQPEATYMASTIFYLLDDEEIPVSEGEAKLLESLNYLNSKRIKSRSILEKLALLVSPADRTKLEEIENSSNLTGELIDIAEFANIFDTPEMKVEHREGEMSVGVSFGSGNNLIVESGMGDVNTKLEINPMELSKGDVKILQVGRYTFVVRVEEVKREYPGYEDRRPKNKILQWAWERYIQKRYSPDEAMLTSLRLSMMVFEEIDDFNTNS